VGRFLEAGGSQAALKVRPNPAAVPEKPSSTKKPCCCLETTPMNYCTAHSGSSKMPIKAGRREPYHYWIVASQVADCWVDSSLRLPLSAVRTAGAASFRDTKHRGRRSGGWWWVTLTANGMIACPATAAMPD
jgi:hypothetical protein